MSGPSFLSLTEAISLLALGKPFNVERLSHELQHGHFRNQRAAVEGNLASAARQFSDAGSRGEIPCVGRKVSGPQATQPLASLEPVDFLNHPLFFYPEDALLFSDAQLVEPLSEYELGFLRHLGRPYIRDVRVESAALAKAFGLKIPPPMGSNRTKPFTPNERRKWMAGQPRSKADAGWNNYKTLDRRCGITRESFRKEWSKVHGTRRGRPVAEKPNPAG